MFVHGIFPYCRGDKGEDQHPPNVAEEDPHTSKQDEEANLGDHRKGAAAGSSKTWVA